jgi:SAM-dependent methyltransferase
LDRAALDEHDRVEDVHWWFLARRRIVLDRLSRLVPPAPDRLVVEVGCGTGANLAALAARYRVLGIEPDAIAAERARQKSGAAVLVGALPEAAGLIPAEAAAVLCLDVLEHVAEDRAALAALAARMRPGAALLVTVPAGPGLFGAHDRALGHCRRYTRRELAGKLIAAGFQVQFISYFNTLLLPPAWLWRRLRGGRGARTDLTLPWAPVNWLLGLIFGFERLLLRLARLPAGLSLIAEALRA